MKCMTQFLYSSGLCFFVRKSFNKQRFVSNYSLFTFFLEKKSNKKFKPVRKGNSFSLEISADEPAPGTRELARALMPDFSFVIWLVNLLRSFFDFRRYLKLRPYANRKIGAMEILLARSS